jgi:hypothetical protein
MDLETARGMARVTVEALEDLRYRIADGFAPSPGSDLEAMMTEICDSLRRMPHLTAIVARKTGGHTHHIEVECSPIGAGMPADTLIAAIERVWDDELRYDDFSAHSIDLTNERGVLDFLTATRAERLYLSGMIVIRFTATTAATASA